MPHTTQLAASLDALRTAIASLHQQATDGATVTPGDLLSLLALTRCAGLQAYLALTESTTQEHRV